MKNSTTNTLEITVIVSTYNRPDALDLTLCALNEQDYPDFEIIIADDGSDEATATLIREHEVCRQRAVHHVWQPDEGFRLAAIRNKGILKASGAYIVFLDGDCVPLPNFVSRHAALAQRGRCVTGGRIKLSQAFTDEVLSSRKLLHRSTFRDWVWMRRTKKANHLLYFFSLPDGPWRHFRPRSLNRLYGCNMAVWMEDLRTVGGFDERFAGWGSEDKELVTRLMNAGIYRKDGRYGTGVMHLWHPVADRSREDHNRQLLRMVVESRATRAVKGLNQYIGRFDKNLPQAESNGHR